MDVIITPAAISGRIEGISSKSLAHRALICAALSKSKSQIRINRTSADIEATVNCLEKLGAVIEKNGNLYSVTPIETLPSTADIDCGESGSTLRFLLPVICAMGINCEIRASGKLPERPLSPLKEELIRMGAEISDSFPLRISGKITKGEFTVKGDVSSQFVSGLLFALSYLGDGKIKLLPPVESRPYIDMTLQTLRAFGADITEENSIFYINSANLTGCDFTVEADWSNAAPFICMGAEVTGLDSDSAQGDKAIADVLKEINTDCKINAADIPDLIPVIAAVAATANGKTVIYNATRLRYKESDRIETTCEMLRLLGADICETDDGMIINGKKALSGGETPSFNDHRIVMAAAVAAARCSGRVIIRNADAINKSYPAFFDDYNRLGGNARVL